MKVRRGNCKVPALAVTAPVAVLAPVSVSVALVPAMEIAVEIVPPKVELLVLS